MTSSPAAGLLAGELNRRDPHSDVQLAVVLSTATRIEPELVRAVRLSVLPRLDVGAESDFWFSPWIGARQAHVVALNPELLPLLRTRLSEQLRTSPADDPIHRLAEVIASVHRRIASALALEERINWQFCAGQGAAAPAALLRHATNAMVEQGRHGLADWAAGARRRLPGEVLRTTDGWHLVLLARRLRPHDILDQPDRTQLVGDRLLAVLGPVASVDLGDEPARVWVRRTDERVTVRTAPSDGDEDPIPLPPGLPPVVELIEAGRTEGDWHFFGPNSPLRHEPSAGLVRLRAVDGAVFDLPPPTADTVRAAETPVQVRITVSMPGDRSARLWLQPVSFDASARPRPDLPSALLALAAQGLSAGPDVLRTLTGWLNGSQRVAALLLHGCTRLDRVRLVDQAAADSQRSGWHVYRAHHEQPMPDHPTAARPRRADVGLLVVVDQANSWHPDQLWALMASLAGHDHPRLRMLLVADQVGPWSTELGRIFDEHGIDNVHEQLTRPAGRTRDRIPKYDRSVDAITAALHLSSTWRIGLPNRATDIGGVDEGDIPLLATVTVLDVLHRRRATTPSDLGRALLRDEQSYRRRGSLSAPDVDALARLVFLAALVRPLTYEEAHKLAPCLDLVDRTWFELVVLYEAVYGAGRELDPLLDDRVADDLLALVLVDEDAALGVDPSWARELLGRLTGPEFPAAVPVKVVSALAHAAVRHHSLASAVLQPLLREHLDLLLAAGSAVIIALVPVLDLSLLAALSKALQAPENRRADLDVAFAAVEERLVAQLFQQGVSSPLRDAPLHRRLAHSRARAGLVATALAAARSAVDEYQRLAAFNLLSHTRDLGECLILLSALAGESGLLTEALSHGEEAERRFRQLHARSSLARPGANLGSALANLGREKARAGMTPGALTDATEAVHVLRDLVDAEPDVYQPELADALVSQSRRLAEAGSRGAALTAATDAVALCRLIVEGNHWAHQHRLADAVLCAGARLADGGGDDAALARSNEAVDLYQSLAEASPERFTARFAESLCQVADQLAGARRWAECRSRAEQAVELYRREAPRRAGGAGLGMSLAILGTALAELDGPAAAGPVLQEAIALLGPARHDHPRAPAILRQAVALSTAVPSPVHRAESHDHGNDLHQLP